MKHAYNRSILISLLVVFFSFAIYGCGSGGGGGNDDGGGDGSGDGVINIDSGVCTVETVYASYKIGDIEASGTAEGEVGSTFRFGISNGGQTNLTFDCGGWTKGLDGGANNSSCVREEGDPETTTWTFIQEVYWCTSDCNLSPDENNADKPVKHTYAIIRDSDSNEDMRVDFIVTCL